MRLILTHEQADFDAVASQLAAAMLDPSATPVLPRRLNRNVRAFLTLYGAELPFTEFDDLPRARIEEVTLVDSQSLTSLRGLGAHTRVHVVDHHPLSPGLNPAWSSHVEEVGATTTLLVESLQEAFAEPDWIRATMLLLGVYEDTGSLSYASTTARDAYAGAWLLERGASLAKAADFLHHPLTDQQRQLYERLLESAETQNLHGLSVVIACAEAKGFTDEVSTLAHKLRDLFDPAAVFVIVALGEHVQLVARSTSDALDVARVAEHFGGGGHSRAAAAVVKDRSQQEIRRELLQLVAGLVTPPKTVGQIMSSGPHVLEPAVTVAEALELMQRSGHEGYPVVEHGEVVGLLTRRAVDRATAHGLSGVAVSKVMEAGSVKVHPDDSVEHLQRVMIEHDWGQVPVTDPERGQIVGIVTRTDLLKTLAEPPRAPRDGRFSAQMEARLTPARRALLRLVSRHAEERRAALYLVGGFVRDLLLDLPSTDFDLVVEGEAIGLARALAGGYGGRVSSFRQFGTAKWRLDTKHPALEAVVREAGADVDDLPSSLDFVTARSEFYEHPSALPSVERGSIKLDLHRRDFSINTLALRLDGHYYGELLDFWGGGRDLREGLVRVLHSLSFVDDPTRMLRAVRLQQRLSFQIEPRTLQLMEEALSLLDRVSGERIRNELELAFLEPQLTGIMARLQQLGLLTAIHPALTWDSWLEEAFGEVRAFSAPAEWRLIGEPATSSLFYAMWLLRLSEADANAVCARLRFSLRVRSAILDANRLARQVRAEGISARPSAVVKLLDELREDALVAAWIASPAVTRDAIARYLTLWRGMFPKADGEALRALGLPPGPAYRRILGQLRDAWLDGEVHSLDEEQALMRSLVAEA
ncbi:MAG TPA: CBS domain-containing protein [Anaerolineales bacterium]|nr:CBS domain-containing protein [Anaerolineales bacterium]